MKQRDIVKLSAETGISLVTVRKWSKGQRVYVATRLALDNAAKVLGIDASDTTEPAKSGQVA